MIEVTDMIQGSDEWLKLRVGVLTASNFSKVLAKGEGKVRKSLMLDMAAENLSGEPQESFESEWTIRGSTIEPDARAGYAMLTSSDVREIGFAFLDEHRLIGCSPDALVGEDGGLEIKCPKPKTHIEYLLADKIPPQYVAQVQGSLWVTGRKWWDFVSYCPSIADNPMFRFRVTPNEEYISNLKTECGLFLVELDELINKIKNA
jgi:predicted phage-related endonuclease